MERLTGCKVLAFISGNHLDPDVACELFILAGRLENPARLCRGSVGVG
ncbi:MAG TPA: hypothetical protein VLP43_05640 [Solirubrobacteraceae bacterium]|nr:hypothetical protein [Solirubrobacteraceae bacterium]